MELGQIIREGDEFFIVTEVTCNGGMNKEITKEPLEEYVSRVTVLQCEGQPMTIKEIIESYCRDMISARGVLEAQ